MSSDLEKRVRMLEDAIIRLSMDNMMTATIEDTTASTANTKKLIPHGMGKEPQGYVILFGDVYVKDYDETQVDVRSTQASTAFKIKLLK